MPERVYRGYIEKEEEEEPELALTELTQGRVDLDLNMKIMTIHHSNSPVVSPGFRLSL